MLIFKIMVTSYFILNTSIPGDEFAAIAYVAAVALLLLGNRVYKHVKLSQLPIDYNDAVLHSMHPYILSADLNSKIAIKKHGMFTKLVIWGLILFFVVTPIYQVLPLLEPKSIWDFSYGCFSNLQR